LSYLAEALEADDPALFNEYVAWVKSIFAGLNFPEDTLSNTLGEIRLVLNEALLPDIRPAALAMLDGGLRSLDQMTTDLPSYIDGDGALDRLAREFLDALLVADRHRASQMILAAVNNGVSVKDVYIQIFQRTQREIGRLWQMNRLRNEN
jgi:hypothetical protein